MTNPLPVNVDATDWSLDADKGAAEHRQWHDRLHTRTTAGGLLIGGTRYLSFPGQSSVINPSVLGLQFDKTNYYGMVVESPVLVDALVMEVTTAGGSGNGVRMGIYTCDADWAPQTLIVDTGLVLADTTGVKVATFTSMWLSPGRYVTATKPFGAPSLRILQTSPVFGVIPTFTDVHGVAFVQAASGSGGNTALPSTPAAYSTISTARYGAQPVLLRVIG